MDYTVQLLLLPLLVSPCLAQRTLISSHVSPSSLKRLSFADLSTTRLSPSLSESLSEPARNLQGSTGATLTHTSKQAVSHWAKMCAPCTPRKSCSTATVQLLEREPCECYLCLHTPLPSAARPSLLSCDKPFHCYWYR